MQETSKLNSYRLQHNYNQYFNGDGIDIGCGDDPLNGVVFHNIKTLRKYDKQDGDAQTLSNINDGVFDFVYSSHCLEHMINPYLAFANWVRICKTGGYLVIAVPHEIYYEKGIWPSIYNNTHRYSFRMEPTTRMPKSINVYEFKNKALVTELSISLILKDFDFSHFYQDQTRQNGVCQEWSLSN